MEQNPNQPEHTPEEIAEFTKRREQYDKSASRLARSKNSFFENVSGRGFKKNDVIEADAFLEDVYEFSEEDKNSNLLVHEIHDDPSVFKRILEGTINGKNIKIELEGLNQINIFSGTLDGKKLLPTDAERIFQKYIRGAMLRTQNIDNLKRTGKDIASKEDLDGIL